MSTATLTWTPPATRTDGSPLPPDQIANTHVFDGATDIGTIAGAGGTFTTEALTPGAHTFTVVVHDVEGNASAASNPASVTVPSAAPSVVSDLAAVLNP